MDRPSKDVYLMALASVAALRTTCVRRAVGCVLADERGRVLSIGYNGVAAGQPHCNERREVLYASPFNPALTKAAVQAHACHDLGIQDEKVIRAVLEPGRTLNCANASILRMHVLEHACQDYHLPTGQDSCEAVHAEQNALIQCRDPDRIHSAYVTLAPCKACMKLLLGTACCRIVHLDEHGDLEPRRIWERAGRAWERVGRQWPMADGGRI